MVLDMPIQKIKKRDGRLVDFDPSKIRDAVHRAFIAVEQEDGERAEEVTGEVVRVLEERFRERIPSVEDAQDAVVEVLRKRGYERVAEEYQSYREKKEEIRRLRQSLGIPEPKLTVNALEVLRSRYLLKDETGRIVETPQQMFSRVAKAIAGVDRNYGEDPEESERIFYGMMARLEFLPNSPTLFNAGTEMGQLSACFVLPVEDSLESILMAVKNMAIIEKSGGGVGFDFSRLRPKGDLVKSTMGVASGPVSFMRIFDITTEVIKAGGRRRGAMMGILRVDHPDILEFITCKRDYTFLQNFNLSVSVTDEFMEKVEEDGEYWLINPRNGERVEKLRARSVWRLMAESAWASGDPGVIFIDEINRHNPTPGVGRIEATNPCVPVYTWVMTEEGPRQVGDLIGRKFVVVANGGKWETTEEGFFRTGVRPVYRLITREGFEVCLTWDHPVLRVKGRTGCKRVMEWVPAGKPDRGDKVLLNRNRVVTSWEGKFTFEEGYLVGLFLGDGKEGRVGGLTRMKELPNGSDSLGKLAEEMGLRPGERRITVPMEKASSAFCRGLIRGLFDVNGSVRGSKRRGVSVRLVQDREVLRAVQRILLRFGIYSKIRKGRVHELVISGEDLSVFARKIGFGDPEKRERLERLLSLCKGRVEGERFLATVEGLVFKGMEEVFDVRVPGVNLFDANGFCVHNCGEQPLLPYESCNLGSINLSRMVEGKEVDWEKLGKTVRSAVHFLDNVIDANRYPLREIEEITKANRKIGLGVMGFADMLIKLGIPYDSEEALRLAEKLMRFISEEAREKSVELAEERGSFPNFERSIWKDRYGAMRNATVTTIAPTGSITIIAGCSSGIEPIFALSFIRKVLGGRKLFEIHPLFELMAKERGFYSARLLEEIAKTGSLRGVEGVPEDLRRIFVTALDIPPEWHVRMQAAFQKYTDNAVSKTVNLPPEATVEEVERVYELAWKLRCKGVTVFRYGSKPEQVLYIGREARFVAAEAEYAGGCPTRTCPFPG